MNRTATIFLAVTLVSCATYSQVFVNAHGDLERCSATGQGVVGMAVASNSVSTCASDMRAAGYLEIERAGVLGITLADTPTGEPLRILKVTQHSPAWKAGVDPGDLILEIDGQPVQSAQDARILLFGEAGTSVTVRFQRGDFDTTFAVNRAPYRSVFGTGPRPPR